MQRGIWVPIDKRFISMLPKDRPYSEIEAVYSVTCDHDEGNLVTENGYAALWKWSRGKVSRFAKKTGFSISRDKPRAPGRIIIDRTIGDTRGEQGTDNKQTRGGQGLVRDSKWIRDTANKERTIGDTRGEQGTDNGRYTTKEPNPKPNPNPNPKDKKPFASNDAGESEGNQDDQQPDKPKTSCSQSFEKIWAAYPRKQGKKAALKIWKRDKLEKIAGQILSSLELQKKSESWTKDNGQFIPAGSTWFNGARWEDELEQSHISTPPPNGKKFDKEKYLNGGMNPMFGDGETE